MAPLKQCLAQAENIYPNIRTVRGFDGPEIDPILRRLVHKTQPVYLFFFTLKDKMAEVDDYDFSTGDAGASHVFNMEAGQVRVGG